LRLVSVDKWFLDPTERGNRSTAIDRQRGDGRAWTEGNQVTPLIHGATYFARLHEHVTRLGPGDHVWFLEWRGDAGQRMAGPGTELGSILTAAIRRGVDVRGLVWRSHPDQTKFSEQENAHVGMVVNAAGGEVLLDERVRRFGSHHQKLVLITRDGRPDEDIAFVGGIDLCHGRGDDERHLGDPQAADLDPRYGPQPAWHDVQLEVRGPGVGDLAEIFRERWSDPTPLDHQDPFRRAIQRLIRQPRRPSALPAPPDSPRAGGMAVQVLRTYPAKRPPFPFAPQGERSVARAYTKALARARSLIYVEDQYFWSTDVARHFADALRRSPDLRMIVVVPKYPDRNGFVSGPLNRIGQLDAMAMVREAGGPRVAFYDIENEDGRPIYVHGKVCVIDDVWISVGSDNLNRRSWTHDSEATCAVLDPERDERQPVDPGGQGDGARVFARTVRMTFWREHLGSAASEQELLDPLKGFEAWKRAADALDAWHASKEQGPRPGGRVRVHHVARVGTWARWWARPLYRLGVDPDGRPRAMSRSGAF